MATNLEDVVKQLHKNNTETANLNRNFKQWFLTQERARLDALEKERESKSEKSDKPAKATKIDGNSGGDKFNVGLFGLMGLAGKLGTFLAGISALGLTMVGLRGWELPLIKKLNGLTGFTTKIGDIIEETKSKFKTNFKTLIPRLGIQIKSFLRPLTVVGTALSAYFLGPGAKIGASVTKFFGGSVRGIGSTLAPISKLMGKILWPLGILISVYEGFVDFGKSDEETFLGKFGDGFSGFVASFIGAPLDLLKNGLVWGVGKMFGLETDANGVYTSKSGLARFLQAAKDVSFEDTIKTIVKAPFDLFINAANYIEKLSKLNDKEGSNAVFKKLWEDTKLAAFGTVDSVEWLFDLIVNDPIMNLVKSLTGAEFTDKDFTLNPITGIKNLVATIKEIYEVPPEDEKAIKAEIDSVDGTRKKFGKDISSFFQTAGDNAMRDLKGSWLNIQLQFQRLTAFLSEMPQKLMISMVGKINDILPERIQKFVNTDELEISLTQELKNIELRNIERQSDILLKQLQGGNITSGQYLQDSAMLLKNADRGGTGQLLYQDNSQNNPINSVSINNIPGPLRLSGSSNDGFGDTVNTGKKGPSGY